MVEHMWKFFLIVPIPLVSTILGLIYTKRGYKGKKNIIAGIIMTSLLCVFGNFTNLYSDYISHDIEYLNYISDRINIAFPKESYISIEYSDQGDFESRAMVKFYNDVEAFEYMIDRNKNWKPDTSFIPVDALDLYTITFTAEYDYYLVYNLSENNYNTFDGDLLYLAYNMEDDLLFIVWY